MEKVKYILKGLTLLIWIVVLVYFSALVTSQKVPGLLERSTNHLDGLFQGASEINNMEGISGTGLAYLYEFNSFTKYTVLSATLNKAIPNWIDVETIFIDQNGKPCSVDAIRSYYYALFDVIDEHLIAIVQNPDLDPDRSTFNQDLVPSIFRKHMTDGKVNLPEIAVNYIKNQRVVDDTAKLREQLVATFFILLVLGAFGSLVFLIKDFLSKEDSTNCVSYIFRPILGMFLAMAIFFIDMLAHSIISASAIEQLRVEPLYILGFSAGLLSEQAYEIIKNKAENSLNKTKNKKA